MTHGYGRAVAGAADASFARGVACSFMSQP